MVKLIVECKYAQFKSVLSFSLTVTTARITGGFSENWLDVTPKAYRYGRFKAGDGNRESLCPC